MSITEKRLNEIQERLDETAKDWGYQDATSTDLADLLAEVQRLRALTTVNEDMVERGARAFYEYPTPGLDASLRTDWGVSPRHPPTWQTTTAPTPAPPSKPSWVVVTMSDRKLYALTDGEASELRRLMDQAQSQALTDQDGVTYEDLTHLMIPLNTPLDTDDAVERMARAILQRVYGGNVDLLGCDAWGVARGDARAALAALLGGGQS